MHVEDMQRLSAHRVQADMQHRATLEGVRADVLVHMPGDGKPREGGDAVHAAEVLRVPREAMLLAEGLGNGLVLRGTLARLQHLLTAGDLGLHTADRPADRVEFRPAPEGAEPLPEIPCQHTEAHTLMMRDAGGRTSGRFLPRITAMDLEALKREAALTALTEVESGMRLGLGTGSTVFHFLVGLGAALREGRLKNIAGVPTSERTARQCREEGIPLLALEEAGALDLAVDGADEVDPRLDLIKGLGGALLREKMVALQARRFIVIADHTKDVKRLGTRSPLPVEVVPFAWRSHLDFLGALGCRVVPRSGPTGDLFLTDNGNVILDLHFANGIADAGALAKALDARPGIVDHGLFLGLCARALLATPTGVQSLSRPA